jgi:hypothetical protein
MAQAPAATVSWICVLIAMLAGGCERSGPAACVAAGGQCVLGGGSLDCLERGPQDCNPDVNPGGAICCLKAGPPRQGNQNTGATMQEHAGSGASAGAPAVSTTGPADCMAAGGRCLIGGGAPGTCQVGPFDCNPERNPGGAVCCLNKMQPDQSNPDADAG